MPSVAVLTGAFLRFKLSRVLRYTNGRDGSPIKNDYSFLINRNITWGGFNMFSIRGVSECLIYLREQKGATIVDSFYITLHEQYTVK